MAKPDKKTGDKCDITLETQEALNLLGAYRALEGRAGVIDGDGDKKVRGPVVPYRFTTNPDVVWTIEENQLTLRPIEKTYAKSADQHMKAAAPFGTLEFDPKRKDHQKRFMEYQTAMESLNTKKITIKLAVILRSDLDIGGKDGNDIPATVCVALAEHGLLVGR